MDLVADALAARRALPGVRARIEPPRRRTSGGTPRAGRAAAGGGARVLNIANGLTMLRLLLVPVFVCPALAGGTGWRVCAFAGLPRRVGTDLLDGRSPGDTTW